MICKRVAERMRGNLAQLNPHTSAFFVAMTTPYWRCFEHLSTAAGMCTTVYVLLPPFTVICDETGIRFKLQLHTWTKQRDSVAVSVIS